MVKKLLQSVREFKVPTFLTFLLMIGEAVAETAIPYIAGTYLINTIQEKGENLDMEYIIKIGLILIGLAILSLLCGGFAGMTSAKAAAGFARNLRGDVFDKVQSFSFKNIDKFSSASLVTRMTTDISNVQMSYLMIIRTAIRSPLMIIFSVTMAIIMAGKLAYLFAVIIPILGIGLFIITKKANPAFHRVFQKYDILNESIEENVRGMRVVKGFSKEDYEKKKFGKAADSICDDFTKAERIVACTTPLMNFCMYFNMVFILIIGSILAINSQGKDVNIGQISVLLTYGVQVLMSLMMLSFVFVIITISLESMRRVHEVLCEEPSISNPENAITEVKDGAIDFDNVSFKYSEKAEKYALSGINLHIQSGMTVGVLGGTGSSKSSLVQLIPRLYDVSEGSVKVGGVDVREYDLNSLRDSVAMVLQKNELFSGTINENLRWGNENATDEEIVEACKLAQADEFIVLNPDGYNKMIEQGGTNVSGGQKQRLCIARALLKKPKILILDDSTSAVDTKTDALIRQGFKSYIPDTTKIIIAQRVSSVMDSDLIVIMDNGSISAMGTHEELLKTSEIYREIYTQQTYGGANNE